MSQPWKRILVAAAVLLAAAAIWEGLGSARAGRSDFTGTDLRGRSWSLKEYRGRQPVLVSFFATWCGPCHMEFPELVKLHQKFGRRGLQVVVVTEEPAATVREFPDLVAAPIPILAESEAVFRAYGISSLPHTVFFDARGEVELEVPGYSPQAIEEIDRRLESMLPG